jgi:hypothetical protein
METIFVPGKARATPFGRPKQGASNTAGGENRPIPKGYVEPMGPQHFRHIE